jgi:hypothetical protein
MACLVAALAACSGGGAPSPQGWKKSPGAAATWTNGTPAQRQTYAYDKAPFGGTLQDLAQREIVNTTLRDRALKFVKSDVFRPCPGLAGIATFSGAGQTVQDAFAVESGNAVVVRYQRPAAAHDDPAAVAAMQRAICVAPG